MMLLVLKLVLAHAIGDFVLQPDQWVKDKTIKKHKSKYLYFHVLIHALALLILLQFNALNDRALFELLQSLGTESRNPRTRGIDLADTRQVLDLIHAEDRSVLDRVAERLDDVVVVVDHVVDAFRAGGRLLYVGAGTSGRLGVLDAAECPPTYSTDPGLVTGLIAGGYPTLVRIFSASQAWRPTTTSQLPTSTLPAPAIYVIVHCRSISTPALPRGELYCSHPSSTRVVDTRTMEPVGVGPARQEDPVSEERMPSL